MGIPCFQTYKPLLTRLVLGASAYLILASTAGAWWDKEWPIRKKITFDTSAAGGGIAEPIGPAAVLVRLHDGNFQFASAKEDGSDLRFIAEDDKTLLPYDIERFDNLLNEAFVWVKLPEVKAGALTALWVYYGNTGPKALPVGDSKATYDAETVLVYHFSESGVAPVDASPAGNNGQNAGTSAAAALIGGGLRLTGSAVNVPASPTLAWASGGTMTWSAWVKPAVLQSKAVLFSRREGDAALVISIENGVPIVEASIAGTAVRSSAGEPMAVNVWRHLAITATASQLMLFLDGVSYGTASSALPALNTPLIIGKDSVEAPDVSGFSGEIDELQISRIARPVGRLKLQAINQGGGDKAAKLLVMGEDEATGQGGGGGELAKHFTLLSDISKSLTVDGWIVIFLCGVLALVGWVVAIGKFLYLNRIQKASGAFLKQWETISSDLTALDHTDADNVRSLGGKATGKTQKLMRESPLYHIYQIGSDEIRHRLTNAREGVMGLSSRSIQAIRATLDGGLVREVQRLNKNLVFLTIGIAGGPYLGLLGTVIGVMITFAVIAKSGEVEVNSIAPGIAGALLATVAGLAVAIPALFAYSYISTRIKEAVSDMQVFIDEFVAKIAEFYPTGND